MRSASAAAARPASSSARVGATARPGRRHPVERQARADEPGGQVQDVRSGRCPARRPRGPAIASWSASPAAPVAAFAQPLVETTAAPSRSRRAGPRTVAARFAREQADRRGRERVRGEDRGRGRRPAGRDDQARSGRPEALMPAAAPPARSRPAGRPVARPAGASSGSIEAPRCRRWSSSGREGELLEAGGLGQAVDEVERLDGLARGALDEVVHDADGEDPAGPLVEADVDPDVVAAGRRAWSPAALATTRTNGSSS